MRHLFPSMTRLSTLFVIFTALSACKPRTTVQASSAENYTEAEAKAQFGLQFIPDVINATGDGDAIPVNVVRDYDTRTVGESLAFRLHRLVDTQNISGAKESVNWMPDSQIALIFKHEIIREIGENGFLNQHQLPKSAVTGGVYDPATRREIENYTIAATLGQGGAWSELRPKFGFLTIKETKDLGRKQDGINPHFGDWIAIFKPSVEYRTTITNRDSANGYLDRLTWLGYPKTKCTPNDWECRHKYQNTMYGDSVALMGGEYFEAQIWGKLDIKDVDYFLVPSSIDASDLDYLKTLGCTVKTFDWDYGKDSTYRTFPREGTVLYAGDDDIQKRYEQLKAAERRHPHKPIPTPVPPPVVPYVPPVNVPVAQQPPNGTYTLEMIAGNYTDDTGREVQLAKDGSGDWIGATIKKPVDATWHIEEGDRVRFLMSDHRKMWYHVSTDHKLCFAGTVNYDQAAATAEKACMTRPQ